MMSLFDRLQQRQELFKDAGKVTRMPQQGEASIKHVETMLQSWFRQKELLKVLNDKRWTRHQEMETVSRNVKQTQTETNIPTRPSRASPKASHIEGG
jgi:hypothetical protein